jgi:hypothetical protein
LNIAHACPDTFPKRTPPGQNNSLLYKNSSRGTGSGGTPDDFLMVDLCLFGDTAGVWVQKSEEVRHYSASYVSISE